MLAGDEATFAALLTTLVLRTLSVHDVASAEPERVYQAFLLGTLLHLEATHDVRSNRESGYGRYDVMVLPKAPGGPGAVLKQLSAFSEDTVAKALDAALAQIHDRRYADELTARGANPVQLWGVVFDGKRVWARRG